MIEKIITIPLFDIVESGGVNGFDELVAGMVGVDPKTTLMIYNVIGAEATNGVKLRVNYKGA